MFIHNTQEIINKFYKRYVSKYDSERGDYDEIRSTQTKSGKTIVEFHISDYWLTVWIDDVTDELHIENENGESIFNFADEFCWEEKDIHFIKFGN